MAEAAERPRIPVVSRGDTFPPAGALIVELTSSQAAEMIGLYMRYLYPDEEDVKMALSYPVVMMRTEVAVRIALWKEEQTPCS